MNIITEISISDAITLGKIQGLKESIKDIEFLIEDSKERTFLIRYINLKIRNLESNFDDFKDLREG